MTVEAHVRYDYRRHVDEQFPPGSLVEWNNATMRYEDIWRPLDACPGEVMLVLQTTMNGSPFPIDPGSPGGFPSCEVLQGDKRRWVAAMYLHRVE